VFDPKSRKRALWISRGASLVVVLVYFLMAVATFRHGFSWQLFFLVGAAWGLPLIWFPGHFGRQTGWIRQIGVMRVSRYVDEESPPFLVAAMGWFFLVGLPLVLYYILRSS
jgi:hypothetical protein